MTSGRFAACGCKVGVKHTDVSTDESGAAITRAAPGSRGEGRVRPWGLRPSVPLNPRTDVPLAEHCARNGLLRTCTAVTKASIVDATIAAFGKSFRVALNVSRTSARVGGPRLSEFQALTRASSQPGTV